MFTAKANLNQFKVFAAYTYFSSYMYTKYIFIYGNSHTFSYIFIYLFLYTCLYMYIYRKHYRDKSRIFHQYDYRCLFMTSTGNIILASLHSSIYYIQKYIKIYTYYIFVTRIMCGSKFIFSLKNLSASGRQKKG